MDLIRLPWPGSQVLGVCLFNVADQALIRQRLLDYIWDEEKLKNPARYSNLSHRI